VEESSSRSVEMNSDENVNRVSIMNTIKVTLRDTQIFVVHYKKMTQRKEFLDKWFSNHEVPVRWILDGQREDLTDDVLKKYYLYRQDQCGGRFLSLGEIGCTIGHISAMQKIVDENHPYGLIFEDDVYLDDSFMSEFDYIMSKCPSDFDVISLGSCCGIRHENSHLANIDNRLFRVSPPRGRCGYAQLISNRACRLALQESIPFSYPADWQVYNIASNNKTHPFVTYWVEPPIAFEGSKIGLYQSSIR
jgi:glycosyl transferase family 25